MRLYFNIYFLAFGALFLSACNKFVEVPSPATELIGTSVYNSNSTAGAAVSGIYLTMASNSIGGSIQNYGISAILGLSADEFNSVSNQDVILTQSYSNSLTANSPPPEWDDLYNCIYQANSAIEGVSSSTELDSSLKQQLIGEAKFIRAFCHFYLVNIYGDVPIVTSPNYQSNKTIARSPQTEVYRQIVNDLNEARDLLSDNFSTASGASTTERVRPNRGAATALLARVYLYQKKWDSADAMSTILIGNPNYQLSVSVNDVFLTNSAEAIWQLEAPNSGFDAPDGAFLEGLLYFGGPNSYAPVTLSDSLMNAFEPGDLRRMNWTDSIISGPATYYYPYKYTAYYTGNPPTEYSMVLRLGEQYLIRAEARAQENNLSGALEDLDAIRTRAGLPMSPAVSQPDVLVAIQKERRVELFTEFGHRWLDLKRTGAVDSVMNAVTPLKGGVWKTTAQLFPIPLTEIQADNQLTQNLGY
jgi:hypothetical protein